MQQRKYKVQLLQRGMSTTAISASDSNLLHSQVTNNINGLDMPQRWDNPKEATLVVNPVPVVHLNQPNSTIKWIIRGILVSFVTLIVVLFIFTPIWVAPTILGVLSLYIAYRISKICKLATRECSRGSLSVAKSTMYKEASLLTQVWSQSNYREALVFYQPVEGYCAHATVNTFLASIPIPTPSEGDGRSTGGELRYCLALPKLPRPYSLPSLFRFITTQAAQVTGGIIRRVELIPGTLSLDEFQAVIAEANRSDIRILANFHRLPLFFADSGSCKRYRKMFAGHWSPVGAYLPPSSSPEIGDHGALLLIDVNRSYGSYVVNVDRLWEAVSTRDFGTGLFRGLLRITLHQPTPASPPATTASVTDATNAVDAATTH